jgi:hypothetical protein
MADLAQERQQAHTLLDLLPPEQLVAVRGLLESILDPVDRALALAPIDDEPETEDERRAVAESKAWFERNGGRGIPHEEVLADLGFTPDDLRDVKDQV